MNWCIMTIYLSICSFMDVKKREINFCFCVIFILVGSIYAMITGRISEFSFFVGIIPGMIFLILGICMKGQIGIGDGVMIITLGFYFDIEVILTILFWSFFTIMITSVAIIIMKKKVTGISIPLAPFLTIGEIGTFVMMWR